MRLIIFLLINFLFSLLMPLGGQANTRQEITDFYLSNLSPEGASDWEIQGREATIEGDYIDIIDMDASYYLEKDIISIKSNKAKLNKENQNMQLDGNVQISNQEGWNLKTDQLNWQRNENYLKTNSPVETSKESLIVKATGMHTDSQLQKADFQRDVEVSFAHQDKENAITINCNGPLEIEYSIGKAIFKNNVIVKHRHGTLFSDTATIFFNNEVEEIIKIVSEGNVKIVRDNNVTVAQKATYLAEEEKLILEGKPRLIFFPQEEEGGSLNFFGGN